MLHVLRRSGVHLSVLALILLAVAGCAKPPKPESNPIDDRASAVGIHLKIRGPLRFISAPDPDVVVFARVEDGVAIEDTSELYGSTYTHDGRAYLMNVEPGTYVAVAAFATVTSTRPVDPGEPQGEMITETMTHRNYFSCDLVERTRVVVEPGEFVFMGSMVTNESMTFGDGDDCQRHVKSLVEEDRSGLAKFFAGEMSRRLDLHEEDATPSARKEFLAKTREYFLDTGWRTLIDAELKRVP